MKHHLKEHTLIHSGEVNGGNMCKESMPINVNSDAVFLSPLPKKIQQKLHSGLYSLSLSHYISCPSKIMISNKSLTG